MSRTAFIFSKRSGVILFPLGEEEGAAVGPAVPGFDLDGAGDVGVVLGGPEDERVALLAELGMLVVAADGHFPALAPGLEHFRAEGQAALRSLLGPGAVPRAFQVGLGAGLREPGGEGGKGGALVDLVAGEEVGVAVFRVLPGVDGGGGLVASLVEKLEAVLAVVAVREAEVGHLYAGLFLYDLFGVHDLLFDAGPVAAVAFVLFRRQLRVRHGVAAHGVPSFGQGLDLLPVHGGAAAHEVGVDVEDAPEAVFFQKRNGVLILRFPAVVEGQDDALGGQAYFAVAVVEPLARRDGVIAFPLQVGELLLELIFRDDHVAGLVVPDLVVHDDGYARGARAFLDRRLGRGRRRGRRLQVAQLLQVGGGDFFLLFRGRLLFPFRQLFRVGDYFLGPQVFVHGLLAGGDAGRPLALGGAAEKKKGRQEGGRDYCKRPLHSFLISFPFLTSIYWKPPRLSCKPSEKMTGLGQEMASVKPVRSAFPPWNSTLSEASRGTSHSELKYPASIKK